MLEQDEALQASVKASLTSQASKVRASPHFVKQTVPRTFCCFTAEDVHPSVFSGLWCSWTPLIMGQEGHRRVFRSDGWKVWHPSGSSPALDLQQQRLSTWLDSTSSCEAASATDSGKVALRLMSLRVPNAAKRVSFFCPWLTCVIATP